jgi:hypothetical protein
MSLAQTWFANRRSDSGASTGTSRVNPNDFAAVTIATACCFGQGEWGKLDGFDRRGARLYVDRPRDHALLFAARSVRPWDGSDQLLFDSALKADPINATN